jgi:GTP-binding protein
MFIDDITLHLKAGRGGDGVVRWRHEWAKELGGPSGGNGGKGGDVYAVAVRDIGALAQYRNSKEFSAGRGAGGGRNSMHGKEGEPLEMKFPVGSRITNFESGYSIDLLEDGERKLLLKGGRGGLGNENFKSSTNVRPKEATPGDEGEEADFHIELLLTADIGLIGLPNAGKSSLLNALTRANSRVGEFPFTTLEPALGDLYGLIIADIPGLIEGASEGKGLGHKFLRHIERTRVLGHCVSSENDDPVAAHAVVRKELGEYNKAIIEKPEIILLTKTDLISPEETSRRIALLEGLGKTVFPVSVLDDKLIKNLGEYLSKTFK